MVTSCARIQGNQFVASGRGGLAANPTDRTNPNQPWQDIRALSTTGSSTPNNQPTANNHHRNPAVSEAVHWQRNHQNQVELIASTQNFALPTADCLG
ncbi:MAG: hypothetical protein AAFO02_25670 [Bacteroidota bacterium]